MTTLASVDLTMIPRPPTYQRQAESDCKKKKKKVGYMMQVVNAMCGR